MASILGFLMFILGVSALCGTIFFLIDQSVHKEMTIGKVREWDYGTFAQFLEQVEKYDVKPSDRYPGSFFSEDHSTVYIHAGIISFQGKGMVLRWYNYAQFLLWKERNRLRPSDGRKEGMWSA